MKHVVWTLSLVVLAACSNNDQAVSTAKDATDSSCAGFAEVPAGTDPVTWLQQNSDQASLAQIFRCAPASAAVPTGLGVGRGTLYQALPIWNDLQADVGTGIWGGKRLYKQPDGQVCLLNQMNDSQTERYMAHAYLQPSSSGDGKNVVVLDYRVDNTASFATVGSPAQAIIDQIVHGIRDEIREVTQNGQGTKVYIGRANLNKASFLPNLDIFKPSNSNLSNISDADFTDPSKYVFGANFFLDFRPSTVVPFGTVTPSCAPAASL